MPPLDHARPFFTIGHSTRSVDDFLALLRAHRVEAIADVRTIPRSRRHPHFSLESLAASLPAEGIAYRHFPDLGGLRKPAPDSANGGWRHAGFRGYADHMQAPAFEAALQELLHFGRDRQVAIMCAEAKWWQCHRQLISDAVTARGIAVHHILTAGQPPEHSLTPFARVEGKKVTYPALI